MPKDLVKIALKSPLRHNTIPISKGVEDLAIAWLKGTITLTQAESGLQAGRLTATRGKGSYTIIARALRQAYAKGRIR